MLKKIKELFQANENSYKPYNMIICANELHKKICNCECHTTKGMLHMVACCHEEKCPDCKKNLNIKK